ncbi:hypothetical protein [Streptomyces sp. NPDC014806]|uniref:hypothetical protein n=1 Tax=Streptomyces sp. NPDC014806 TaxID=3364920 RepID=UPI0036F9979D
MVLKIESGTARSSWSAAADWAVAGAPAGADAVECVFTGASLRGVGLLALHVWETWSARAV